MEVVSKTTRIVSVWCDTLTETSQIEDTITIIDKSVSIHKLYARLEKFVGEEKYLDPQR
jgi:urease alpha subunit